ncbi:MAG: hypothetical protein NT094_03805 [Candidatus Staskawiczbacteria bacterium]|nr:hypothetical protein [Candidatus Staskawiczbacteria bacterium]
MKNNKIKYVIYCRKATDNSIDSTNDIDKQTKLIKNLIKLPKKHFWQHKKSV